MGIRTNQNWTKEINALLVRHLTSSTAARREAVEKTAKSSEARAVRINSERAKLLDAVFSQHPTLKAKTKLPAGSLNEEVMKSYQRFSARVMLESYDGTRYAKGILPANLTPEDIEDLRVLREARIIVS